MAYVNVFMLKYKLWLTYTTKTTVIFLIPMPNEVIAKKNTPLGTILNKGTNTKPRLDQVNTKAEGKTETKVCNNKRQRKKKNSKPKTQLKRAH